MRRNSKQRDLIVQFLNTHEGHFQAQEIYEGLKREGYDISLATVYRNLNILVEDYQISLVENDEGIKVYDKSCKPHDHFICRQCHTIYDVSIPYDRSIDKRYEDLPMLIESHSLNLYGICQKCLKERGK